MTDLTPWPPTETGRGKSPPYQGGAGEVKDYSQNWINMTDRKELPAVVLAGAPAEPEMAAKYAITNRAEIPFAGKTMLRHVVDALNASSYVGEIGVVGNTVCEGVIRVIPPAGTIMDNLIAGTEAYSSAGHVLIVTSDIPLVTPEAIDDFIERCGDLSADFYYPVVSKVDSEAKFPGMPRTYAKLAEGTFTGGNIMVVRAQFIAENGGLIREILNARKSVSKLARLIGFGTLVRALIAQTMWPGALNICALENTVGRILNGKVKAVQTPYAEISADVDKLEHIEAIEKMLAVSR